MSRGTEASSWHRTTKKRGPIQGDRSTETVHYQTEMETEQFERKNKRQTPSNLRLAVLLARKV